MSPFSAVNLAAREVYASEIEYLPSSGVGLRRSCSPVRPVQPQATNLRRICLILTSSTLFGLTIARWHDGIDRLIFFLLNTVYDELGVMVAWSLGTCRRHSGSTHHISH
jgi:hypothetical protein